MFLASRVVLLLGVLGGVAENYIAETKAGVTASTTVYTGVR